MATKKKTADEEMLLNQESADAAIDEALEISAQETAKADPEKTMLLEQVARMQEMMDRMQQQMLDQSQMIQKLQAGERVLPARPKSAAETELARIRQIARECAEAGRDPWTVKVEIMVPHRERGEDPWYWVNINSRSAQIPANDTRQEMALPYALSVLDSIIATKRAEEFEDGIQVFDPQYNPHKNRP